MDYQGRPIDFGPGECDECGDTVTVAKIADKSICGDCCKRGMYAAGVEEDESEAERLQSEVDSLEEEKSKLKDKLTDAENAKEDAEAALRSQEKLADELVTKVDDLTEQIETLRCRAVDPAAPMPTAEDKATIAALTEQRDAAVRDLAEQEKCAADLARKVEELRASLAERDDYANRLAAIKALADGQHLPEPKPTRKPRAKKPAEATP